MSLLNFLNLHSWLLNLLLYLLFLPLHLNLGLHYLLHLLLPLFLLLLLSQQRPLQTPRPPNKTHLTKQLKLLKPPRRYLLHLNLDLRRLFLLLIPPFLPLLRQLKLPKHPIPTLNRILIPLRLKPIVKLQTSIIRRTGSTIDRLLLVVFLLDGVFELPLFHLLFVLFSQ